MTNLTILSGKGGVGKTTLSSNLAILLSRKKKIVAADCDADAPNLALSFGFWEKDFKNWKQVQTNEKAIFDKKKCEHCQKCLEVCNFGAISWDAKKNIPIFNSMLCEGCGACELVCPQKAIKLVKINNGKIGSINTNQGFDLVAGQLKIGSTGSGKIVSLIRAKAEKIAKKQKADFIISDSAAGIGCPVIASIQGSDFIIAVTEPTPSGLSDLKRVLKTVEHFRIPYGVIINKYDINLDFTKKIVKLLKQKKISFLGKIPYNKKFVKSLVNMRPIILDYPEFEDLFKKILERTKKVAKF